MKHVFPKVKQTSRPTWLGLMAGLLLVAVLATTSDAATPGTSAAGLAISVQQSVAPVLSGPIVVRLPSKPVVVPTPPAPRSPCKPPSWVPAKPPWLR